MKKIMDLSGVWTGQAEGLGTFEVALPGTLDTNGIGCSDEEHLAGRLTRLHTFEGIVTYSKKLRMPKIGRGKLLLEAERTRELSICVNGNGIPIWEPGTLSTPFLFDVTAYQNQKVRIELIVDNVYHDWPRASIIGASAATDETQTNWNGILGNLCLYQTELVDITSVRFYPSLTEAAVFIEIAGIDEKKWNLGKLWISLQSDCLKEKGKMDLSWKIVTEPVSFFKEKSDERLILTCDAIPFASDVKYWDEGVGNRYSLTVMLRERSVVDPDEGGAVLAMKEEMVGVRSFGVNRDLRLTLNERPFFLRGETNCCVFPEKGHPPIAVNEWKEVLEIYASYGVNCMRFHSWCPPEAAFIAADQMGMMMQPELSQWNFKDAFATECDRDYYHREIQEILKWYGNHPSFVMLTFGNELQYTQEGYEDAQKLLKTARAYDPTRLYAHSSNYHYGEVEVDTESDFYTAMTYYDDILRATSSPMIGHLNQSYPSADHTYDIAVQKVQKFGKPVFGFEVGQYEVLPEFSEIEQFQGVTRAENYRLVKEQVEEAGLADTWQMDVEATGELALACYREEVESAMRTKQMSGLSLLGLQDFPGQGTALVGMLNSHLKAKPYHFAMPERFRAFFRPVLPLLYLPRYSFTGGESLSAKLELANYGRENLCTSIDCTLKHGTQIIWKHTFEKKNYESGTVKTVGYVELELPNVEEACHWEINLSAKRTSNSYPIWVFPDRELPAARTFYVAKEYSKELLNEIENGANVYLEPPEDKDHFPKSIGGQFSTDFWSVGTFPIQEGAMGMVIDVDHPALAHFPTEFYSQYQWWPMASGRPMILPRHVTPIVRVPDSYSRLKHMGLLFEARVGKGRLMVSSMGLLGKDYPECRGLLSSLFSYLNQRNSNQTGLQDCPCRMTVEEVEELFTETQKEEKGNE
ncbi:MAG: glycoside hydrolase family 2 TIM barrel-domain containing protein [Hespellia sp.]|nr:glycoside hydrolase family 2 TIM barrel-domain containing protein [Hespellia sp.]